MYALTYWVFDGRLLSKTSQNRVQTGPGTPEVLLANKRVFLGAVSGTETGVDTTLAQ